MKCPSCELANGPENRFCGRCGALLAPRASVDADTMDEATARILKDTLARFTERAEVVESRTFEQVRERVLKWAKFELTALGVVGAILGLFGLGASWNVRTQMQELGRIADSTGKMARAYEKMLDSITTAALHQYAEVGQRYAQVARLTDTANHQYSSFSQKLNLYRTELTTLDVADLRNQFNQKMNRLDTLQLNTARLRHSMFNVFLQTSDTGQRRQRALALLDRLGFIVEPESVLDLGVNATEVLGYHESAEEVVRLLTDSLRVDYPAITSRIENRRAADSREIVIKLKEF